MRTFIKENTWLRGTEHGWGNGYVIIPEGHPAHGKHYDELNHNISVHGGLTFSEKVSDCLAWGNFSEDEKEMWVVGFQHFLLSQRLAES